jgi:hypothetical protein
MRALQRLADVGLAILDHLGDLYLGFITLAMGVLFLYWGGRGLFAYGTGVRAAWTEPWVCLLGLVGGGWMLLMTVRLLRGSGDHRRSLLSQPELLVLSLGALAGSVWTFTFAPQQAIAFVSISLAGLGRWWMLHRAGRSTFRPPAA